MAPKVLVPLRKIPELKRNARGLGSATTLTEIVNKKDLPLGLRQAAHQVATVHLRNMGTIGGNLCLDTRCNYYNQNWGGRKPINFCIKPPAAEAIERPPGNASWWATSSPKGLPLSSPITRPPLFALGARVRSFTADTH